VYLKSIQLKQFRNYIDLKLEIDNGINVLIGNNAQGKTNLLEGIFLLVLTKSFRTSKNKNLVNWDNNFLKIVGKVESDNNEESELELIITNENSISQKKAKIDGIETKTIDFIGHLNAVIFEPEDLNLISHEPANRRNFLDILNAQISSEYIYALAKYNKIVKIRNKLLYNIRENLAVIDELFYWDEQILNFGAEIIFQRKQLIKFFNNLLTKFYSEISGEDKKLEIKYSSKIKSTNKEDIRNDLREMFDLSKLDDINQARTTTGPHLEDISFLLDSRDVRLFGSRGEFRSIILALKLAEIEYIKEKTKRNPILLLDDVFSELDIQRQKFLIDILENQQTIVTTTDINNLKDFNLKDLNILKVKNGNIS